MLTGIRMPSTTSAAMKAIVAPTTPLRRSRSRRSFEPRDPLLIARKNAPRPRTMNSATIARRAMDADLIHSRGECARSFPAPSSAPPLGEALHGGSDPAEVRERLLLLP